MVFVFAFAITNLIRLAYNRVSKARSRAFIDSLGEISEIEINIEIYGLGRYNGEKMDLIDMSMPLDIFYMLHERYGVEVDKLSAIYNRGMMDGIKERKEYKNRLLMQVSDLIGHPVLSENK